MKNIKAFTLVELMVTVLLASIVLLALGGVLADAHRGYNQMYNRINSPVVQDAYAARRVFDSVIRKASSGVCEITATSAKVYYYSSASADEPDRYAIFVISGNNLVLSEGTYDSSSGTETETSSRVIAKNVQNDSTFVQVGNSACIQMVLHLNNGKEDLVITCSSIRHNK